ASAFVPGCRLNIREWNNEALKHLTQIHLDQITLPSVLRLLYQNPQFVSSIRSLCFKALNRPIMERFGQTFANPTSLKLYTREKYGPSNLRDILHALAPMQGFVHLNMDFYAWNLDNYVESVVVEKP